MKYSFLRGGIAPAPSLPMRGEWIEIPCSIAVRRPLPSLPMRGEWIEIIWPLSVLVILCSLSPCGESGLKSSYRAAHVATTASLPMRGEWIEIPRLCLLSVRQAVSPHAGRVD